MAGRFEIFVPDARLGEIRDKVHAYDWDRLPDAGGWEAGVGRVDLRRLTDHWTDRFDWRAVERRLNELPQYLTDVDGERIHFVHVRGDGSSRASCWPTFARLSQLLREAREHQAFRDT